MSRLEPGRYDGCRFTQGVYEKKEGKTDAVVLEFDIGNGVRRKLYLYCSDAAWPYTEEKLRALGFNGDFGAIELSNGESVSLDLDYEVYEEKEREKWNLASGLPAAAAQDVVARANARWKSSHPPSRPAGRPGAPPPQNRAPAPAPTPKAPPPPSKAPAPPAPQFDKDSAWDAWEKAGNSNTTDFYRAIEGVAHGREESALTEADWRKVGGMVNDDIPF